MAEWRNAADHESGQVIGLGGARSPYIGPPENGTETRQVHAIGAGYQADHRLQRTILSSGHEDERFHDLSQLHVDRAGRILGRVGRLGEHGHIDGHALARGGLEDTQDGRVVRIGRHGGESSTGTGHSRNGCGGRIAGTIGPMKAMIFDWDGTLVDTLPAITRANAEVLGSYGVAYDDAAYRAAYSPDWRRMYRRLGVPVEHVEEAGGRWLSEYRSLMTEVRAFAGVESAVQRLAGTGYELGIVTAGDRPVVEHQLAATGLGAYFSVVVCGEDIPFAKPHPEPLLHALGQLGIRDQPGLVTYIGDAPDDMRMAQAVGARGVGIVSLVGDRQELEAAGAAEVAESVPAWVATFLDQPVGV